MTGTRRASAALALGSVASGLLAYVLFVLITRGLGADGRRPRLRALDAVGVRRRSAHLPDPALDHPDPDGRARGRRTPRRAAGRPPRRCAGRSSSACSPGWRGTTSSTARTPGSR